MFEGEFSRLRCGAWQTPFPLQTNWEDGAKRNVSKCPLCSNNGTLEHILNFCTVALNQGRLTWRHNSVLQFLAQSFISKKPSELEVYADLDGLHLNGSTIPPDIVPTQQRPDLVIINRKEKLVFIIELTICFERNFEAANARKAERYQHLKNDIEDRGFKCYLLPLEIGSRGYVSKKNKMCIINTLKMNNIPLPFSEIIKHCSKISLLCSYSIFNAYNQPTWSDPPLLMP